MIDFTELLALRLHLEIEMEIMQEESYKKLEAVKLRHRIINDKISNYHWRV